MESFGFRLELIDSVSANARKAADSVKSVNIGARGAQKALDGIKNSAKGVHKAFDFKQELERAERQLKRLKLDPQGYKQLIHAQRELAEQRKKMGREGFIDSFKNTLSFGKMTSAAFLGDLLAESLIEGAHKVVEVISDGIKDVFKAAAGEETRGLAFKLTLGDQGEKAQADVERFARRSSLTEDQTKMALLGLRRAGFSQQSARQAFATAGDIAAAGGQGNNPAAFESTLGLFRHIKTKGGVTKKMLVESLGDVGTTIPDFFAELGKKLKVSAKEAEKMAGEGGKVDPQLLMNMITESVNKRQGGQAGTGMDRFTKTMQGRWDKLKDLPDRFIENAMKSPGWSKLSERLGSVFDALDPESARGKRITTAVIDGFTKLSGYIDRALTPENIDAFIDGLSQVPAVLDKIITASEVIATIWVGAKIIGGVSTLTSMLPALATSAGTATAAFTAMAAPLAAAAAASASLAFAWQQISKTADELGGWDRVSKDFKDWLGGEQPASSDAPATENSPLWKQRGLGGKGSIAPAVAGSVGGGSVPLPPEARNAIHAPVNISIVGVDGNTAKRVATEIEQHVNNLERARHERGG